VGKGTKWRKLVRRRALDGNFRSSNFAGKEYGASSGDDWVSINDGKA
jgi:hypothetical protein